MKVSLLTYALVAGGFLVANASPLRVLLLDAPPNNHPNTSLIATITPTWDVTPPTVTPNRQTCRTRLRQKAIAISNALRQALGLPPIQVASTDVGKGVEHGVVHILPFIGNPNAPTFVDVGNGNGNGDGTGPHHHRFRCRGGIKGFMMRLHRSLNALGPWEGKVVAFVLGCGIGVLIRMVWVLAVITYRSINGGREPENTQTEYSFVLDQSDMEPAEVIFVAPPSYADSDEKAALKEDAN